MREMIEEAKGMFPDGSTFASEVFTPRATGAERKPRRKKAEAS